MKYNKYNFLLIHDPENIPFEWDDWIIQGHKHNNEMKEYPFINGEKKTINVSAEVIHYKPISIDTLINLNLDTIKRMDTIDSLPDRI